MPDRAFTDVYLSAEQVTETHRTLENDHTVTEVELPGVVRVYLHIDGARLLFTEYKAGKVLDALDAAAQAQAQSGQTNGEPAASGPQAEQPSGEQPPAEPAPPEG